jgi:carbon storage regulator CsrA
MLVISRRKNEKLVFPSLGIIVEILRVAGQTVKVGVVAPRDVKVLRDELGSRSESVLTTKEERHELSNALGRLSLAVHLARKLLEAGRTAEADATLESALQSLEKLEKSRHQTPAPRRFRALIVDDDENERELPAGLLGMNGCDCETVADGVAALDHLANGHQPDVVLLDMMMPRCDGPETLRRLRADQRFSRLQVFSLSSISPEELKVPTGPTGFDAWFPKPINPRRLWDAIQGVVRSSPVAN